MHIYISIAHFFVILIMKSALMVRVRVRVRDYSDCNTTDSILRFLLYSIRRKFPKIMATQAANSFQYDLIRHRAPTFTDA